MVGGGLAQVGVKRNLQVQCNYPPPHLRQAACSLPAVFCSVFSVLPSVCRLFFCQILSFRLIFTSKNLHFSHFLKKLSTIGIFIFIFLIFCALHPLFRPFLYFLSTLFRQAFRRSGRGFFLCVFWQYFQQFFLFFFGVFRGDFGC